MTHVHHSDPPKLCCFPVAVSRHFDPWSSIVRRQLRERGFLTAFYGDKTAYHLFQVIKSLPELSYPLQQKLNLDSVSPGQIRNDLYVTLDSATVASEAGDKNLEVRPSDCSSCMQALISLFMNVSCWSLCVTTMVTRLTIASLRVLVKSPLLNSNLMCFTNVGVLFGKRPSGYLSNQRTILDATCILPSRYGTRVRK